MQMTLKVLSPLCVWLAICCGAICSAQNPSESDVTSTPVPNAGHDYIHAPNETVNPANGSLSIRIGVPIPPSRGFTVPFNFAYDSNGAFYLATPCGGNEVCNGFDWVTTTSRLAQGGWSYSVPMLSVQSLSASVPTEDKTEEPDGSYACWARTNFVMQDMEGNRHNLGLGYFNSSDICQGTGSTINQSNEAAFGETVLSSQEGPLVAQTLGWAGGTGNGSEGKMSPVWVTDGDGTTYGFISTFAEENSVPELGCCNSTEGTYPASGIYDRDGNGYNITYSVGVPGSPTALTYTDSIGRTALSIPTFGSNPDTVTVSGLSAPYQVSWTTVNANFTIGMTNLNNETCPGPGSQPSIQAISAITLPNGRQYTFSYDSVYGQVSKITYPTGGYVRYVWGLNSQSEYGMWMIYSDLSTVARGTIISYPYVSGSCSYYYDTPAIVQRFVSYDGVNEVLEQDFTYSTTWNAPSTWGNGAREGTWTQKQTIVVNHDLVRGPKYTYSTVYTYGPKYADHQPNIHPDQQVPVETGIQYYDANGALIRTINKTWGNERIITQQQTQLDNNQLSETDWTYNTNEMVTNKSDYDFGSGARGALLRQTVFPSYHTFSQHIVDKPDSVQLLDGSGNVVAGRGYTYDPVGNLLSHSDWLNATGSSALTTLHTYDGFGNITSTTDPATNTTTYSYTDAFVDTCAFAAPANAYLTGITYPSTNGVAHTESFQYYCASGDLASSTDQNNQTTSYVYNDPMGRLTETDYPSGWGKSTIAYTDTPGSVSMETKRIDQSGSVWADTVDLFDGVFHQISQSVANGETIPWDRSDTCYDGDGRAINKMYPYQASAATGAPGCSGAGDTFVYDALGRTASVTHADSTASTTAYTGRATDVKDEGNGTHQVERISQTDALGRLTNVCEVTGQPQLGVAPSNCGLDYTGTGFLTSYTYNPRGDLTNVSQGTQSRSFQYDLHSRLTQSTNPETGTINYQYDSNSSCAAQSTYPGELISKTDARNITTCMQYDAMHRITGKTYSDGTPAVAYGYDETSKLGVSLTNTTGRMSSQSTAGAYPTGSIFSYDTLGHVVDNSQCTPQNCAGTPFSVTYSGYNVLGGPASSTNGAGVVLSYGYNTAGRLTSLQSSLNDATHPGTLLSGIHYNAFGSDVTSTIGSAPLTDSRAYDLRGRLTSISVGNSSATSSSSTVSISGSEQSTQSQTPTGLPSSVTLRIYGGEQMACTHFIQGGDCSKYVYDTGSVTITVNGCTTTVGYGANSTAVSIASTLASGFSCSTVTARASSYNITFTSVSNSSSANYYYSASSTSPYQNQLGGPSFTVSSSSGNLSGGVATTTTYDSGTVSLTVNGTTSSASYGQNDTSTSVASNLAAAVNTNSAVVTATASGNVIILASRVPGAYTDYSLSASSSSGNGFSPASFSVSTSGSTMAGGSGGNIYNLGLSYYPDSNVQTGSDSINGSWTYTYDDFNRLNTAVSAAGLGCAETYDRYGNRLQQNTYNGACFAGQFTSSGNNNRLDQLSYDAAGNVLNDGTHSYAYDAEGRIATVDSGNTATYVYDAGGHRVRKISGGAVDYLYDLAGHDIAEMNSSGGWNRGEVYAGGQHVATYDAGTTYFTHADWLGTERVRSTVAGAVYSTWTSFPFGEGSAMPNPSPTHFTGKERDSESGNDYFGARYYASSMGRFLSPDPLWIKPDRLLNPQKLNLYAYTVNNPLRYTDPTGMDVVLGRCSGGNAQSCFDKLENGLRKEDRSHVHLVAGDGTNGFAKGVNGITVDSDYHSDSKNFSALQQAANDHSALGVIDVLGKGDSTTIKTAIGWNAKTGTQLGNQTLTMDGKSDPFQGYTFFQFRGSIDSGVMYTTGIFSEIVINSAGLSDLEVSEAMHHELRHLVLGDFGRSVPNALHSPTFNFDGIPRNNADRETLGAEKEVDSNATH
jgi:RHS repeat-associated protein